MMLDGIRFHIKIHSWTKEYGILRPISKIIIHENYLNDSGVKGDVFSHDIALIFVKEKIPKKNIIGLANRAERVGESGKLTGFDEYKDLRDYSRFPVVLQEANLTVLEDRLDDMPTVFTTSVRAGEANGGGPFVWEENGNPVLGGIYTGIARLEGGIKRSMFIRIIDLKHWITYQMKKIL
ncbi:hypothetical protein FO519_008680 [Halicephalobus sp. NKZ332]|nr:hypothetical protein FO519_008680 [Halicephalobus sp. NKZ332]